MKKRMKILATTLATATMLTSIPSITAYAATNEDAGTSSSPKQTQTEESQSASNKGTDLKSTYEAYHDAEDAKTAADQKVADAENASNVANLNADNAKRAVEHTTAYEAEAKQNAENAFQKAADDANKDAEDAAAALTAAQEEKTAADAAKSKADADVVNATNAVTAANQNVTNAQSAIQNSEIENSEEYANNESARASYGTAKDAYDTAVSTYQNAVAEKTAADNTVNTLSKQKDETAATYQAVLQEQETKQREKDAKDAAVKAAENDKAAAEKAVEDANAKIASIQNEIKEANQTVDAKKKDVTAADANVKTAQDQLADADKKAATGVLDFLNWMLTQESTTPQQKADINKAIAYYNQYKDLTIEDAINNSTLPANEKSELIQKIHDRLHYEGELEERKHKVIIQGKDVADATSLEAIESALITMKHLNAVRAQDTYYKPGEIHTNMYLMVESEVMANIEAFIGTHARLNDTDGECMTTGPGDSAERSNHAIEALYTSEREYLTQALTFYGYTEFPTEKNDIDKVWKKANELAAGSPMGHYAILSSDNIMGCGTKNKKGTAVVIDSVSQGLQEAAPNTYYDGLYTVDELTAKFNAYKTSLNEENLNKNLTDAQAALVKATKAQADAEKTVSDKRDALKAAQSDLDAAQAVVSGKTQAVDIAKTDASAAASALTTATDHANIKKRVADDVAKEYEQAVTTSTEKGAAMTSAEADMQAKETAMNKAKAAYDAASQALAALDNEYAKALTDAQKAADDAKAALAQCNAVAEAAAKRANDAAADLSSKQSTADSTKARAAKMQAILKAGTGVEVTDEEFAYLNSYVKGIPEATKEKEAAIAEQKEADKKLEDAKKVLDAAKKEQMAAFADFNIAKQRYKDAVAAALKDYEFEKTSGSSWKETSTDASKGLLITNEQEYDESSFKGVTVDGKTLVKDVDYTVKKGSTDVTLLPAFLKTLGSGTHTIAFLYDYGVAPETSFSIEKQTTSAGGGSGAGSEVKGGGGAAGAATDKPDDTKKDDTKEDGEAQVSEFKDVSSTAWYSNAVKWIQSKGITSGTTPTTYSPDAPCTRAQMVTFLWRCAGSPEAKNAANFKDVNGKHYAKTAVAWAKETGITVGTSDTTFSPDQTCTRAQMAAFLWRFYVSRAAKQKGYTGNANSLNAEYKNGFSDIPADFWAADGVYAMRLFGITSGTTATTYSPDAPCTRAQMAAFLYRMDQMAQKEFNESIVKAAK